MHHPDGQSPMRDRDSQTVRDIDSQTNLLYNETLKMSMSPDITP